MVGFVVLWRKGNNGVGRVECGSVANDGMLGVSGYGRGRVHVRREGGC